MSETGQAAAAVAGVLGRFGKVGVAVSGGVDSLTLATLAHDALGPRAGMFHAVSPAVPGEATERVQREAARQGWRLVVFDAGEFDDPQYRRNPLDRCFFCKAHLYDGIGRRTAGAQIVSGTNLDDLGEFRPGLEAARRHHVCHPYVEAGIGKAGVRALARWMGLPEIARLPAQPCLASRVETGLPILAATLAVVHDVERLVASRLDPEVVRCRVRARGLAVELDGASLARLRAEGQAEVAQAVRRRLRAAGIEASVAFEPYRNGGAFLHGGTGRRP